MPCGLIAIGGSLGALKTLEVVLGGLPRSLAVPVVVVLHRDESDPSDLAAWLDHACLLPVSEVEDKEAVLAGHVYISPAGYHTLLDDGWFSLSTEPQVNSARPSIDVLFESAADAYGAGVVAVVLTGASMDGARGAGRVVERGGSVIVQDPATARAGLMPRAAAEAAPACKVMPLERIAPYLVEFCRRSG